MKKFFAIIGVVLVVAAVGFFVLRKGEAPSDLIKSMSGVTVSDLSLANVVPKDTACFVGIYNIKGNYQALKRSNFFKQLSDLKLWKEIDLKNTLNAVTAGFKAQSGLDLSEKNIMELIGRQLGGAVFVNTSYQKSPSIMLLAKVGTKTKLLAKLLGFTNQDGLGKTSYKGIDIFSTKATKDSPMNSSFCLVGDIFMLEIGEETKNINGVIDLVKSSDKKGSLAKNLYYQSVVEENKNLSYEFFVNTDSALSAFNSPGFPEELKSGNLQTAVVSGLESMSFMGGYGKFADGFYTKTVVIPSEKTDNKIIKKLWSAKPKKSKTVSFVPEDAIFFGASNSLDIPLMWETWQDSIVARNADDANSLMNGLNSLENNIGLSIKDDFLPLLSDEVGYMLSDIDLSGSIPAPQIALMFKIKDKEATKSFMTKLVESINKYFTPASGDIPVLNVARTTIMDQPVNFVTITTFPIPELSPCYAVIDDLLVVATNSKTINGIIEVYKGKAKPLRKSVVYEKVGDVFTDKNNQFAYMNMEKTVDKLVDVFVWLISLRKSAADVGSLNDETVRLVTENVVPFVKSFRSIKALALNTVFKDKKVEKIMVFKVEDF